MVSKDTNLTSWNGDQLLDVLKIMLQAHPREAKVLDARDEAIKILKAELYKRPDVLYKYVETRMIIEK